MKIIIFKKFIIYSWYSWFFSYFCTQKYEIKYSIREKHCIHKAHSHIQRFYPNDCACVAEFCSTVFEGYKLEMHFFKWIQTLIYLLHLEKNGFWAYSSSIFFRIFKYVFGTTSVREVLLLKLIDSRGWVGTNRDRWPNGSEFSGVFFKPWISFKP